MGESMHERYDRDERRLVETAGRELWTSELHDTVVDVAAPILDASAWNGLPADAPPRTSERYTAVAALAAMGLRIGRTVALTVRAGYAVEALGDVRRLFETAGHAQGVADDPSGVYAENWLHGRGRADKPRVAFGWPDDDPLWQLMSGEAHAQFDVHAQLTSTFHDRRLIHSMGPGRDSFWDNGLMWLTARQLIRVLAGLLKVHPHIDQTDFLVTAERLVRTEDRLIAELTRASKTDSANTSRS
jgi:hypothetical protein